MGKTPPDRIDHRRPEEPAPRGIAPATAGIAPRPLPREHAVETRDEPPGLRGQRVVMADLTANERRSGQHQTGPGPVGTQKEIAVLAASHRFVEPAQTVKDLSPHHQVGRGEGGARMRRHRREKAPVTPEAGSGSGWGRGGPVGRERLHRQESESRTGGPGKGRATGPRRTVKPDIIAVEKTQQRRRARCDPGIPRRPGTGIGLTHHRQPGGQGQRGLCGLRRAIGRAVIDDDNLHRHPAERRRSGHRPDRPSDGARPVMDRDDHGQVRRRHSPSGSSRAPRHSGRAGARKSRDR